MPSCPGGTARALRHALLFALLGGIWGSNFIHMKMASATISPMQIAFLRVLCGVFPVLLVAWSQKVFRAAHWRHLPHFLAMALLATVLHYTALAAGTSRLHSGVAGAFTASIPIFSFLLALLFLKEETLSARRTAGVLAGCAGVLLLARPFDGGSATPVDGVLYTLVGTSTLGASFVYAKKFIVPLNIPPLALVCYQLGTGLLVLGLLVPFEGMGGIWQDGPAAIGLVLGLGVLGTGIAYILYYYLVATLGAVGTSSVTYLVSPTALAIGAVFAAEPIGWLECAATALIFAGVLLVNKKPPATRRQKT